MHSTRYGSTLETRPLFFFRADRPEVNVSKVLRIRAISKQEKYPPPNGHSGWAFHGGYGYGNLFFAVDCIAANPSEEIDRLATCLLLYKMQDLFPPSDDLPSFEMAFGEWRLLQSDELPPLIYEELERITLPHPAGFYILHLSEQDSFVKFWSELAKQPWPDNIRWSARRLLRAQQRKGNELDDKLVDLIIALEALVLTSGESGKGTHLSTRAGKLQELQGHLKQKAISDLALAYSARNEIVHDGALSAGTLQKIGGDTTFLRRFIMWVEEYLKIGLRNYINKTNQGFSKDRIIQQLDSLP